MNIFRAFLCYIVVIWYPVLPTYFGINFTCAGTLPYWHSNNEVTLKNMGQQITQAHQEI